MKKVEIPKIDALERALGEAKYGADLRDLLSGGRGK